MSSNSLSGAPEAAAPEPSGAVAPTEHPLTRWQKFKLVVKVVELRLRFIALMAVTGLVFAYWDTLWNYYEKWTRPSGEQHAATSDVEYYCPMHPSVVQDQPGNCPICGMPLSKRKKGEPMKLPEGVVARVQLAPFRVAQAGIRTADVAYAPLSESLTTVGSVSFDERRLARISSKLKGMARVERLQVNFTGTPVKAGEPLAELYSPELYQAVRELLLAQRRARETPPAQSALGRSLLGGGEDLVRLATEKLKLWGITQAQVDEILREGRADYRLPILSPISGVVVRKDVVEGQYVAEGEAMFEVADLSHVWVQAQVYEDQFDRVRVGQAVEATVGAFPGRAFPGTVAFIDPVLNPTTRTVGVRYDLVNADGRLRPGMFATVTLKTPVAETPAFRAKLTSSVSAGAHPAHVASLTVEEQQICPVTEAKLGSMGEPLPVAVGERRVWVCCEGCPSKLKAEPAKYLARLVSTKPAPEMTLAGQKVCPVTGNALGSMGDPIAVAVEGRTVWVCCPGCPPKLKAEPAKYLARLAPAPEGGVLSVPEAAVIDTGDRTVVYVETEPGVFEGRTVVLGPRIGDRFPVLEGLVPGEKVAAAGAFLIDAETRLTMGAGPAPEGTNPNPATPTRTASAAGPAHRH